MGVVIRLDEFERRHIACQKCFERGNVKPLKRLRSQREWQLQCPECQALWPEASIRSGKAIGVLVLDD